MMKDPGVPLLRKDFIFDPLQVAMTASSPASAVLLIARMCEDATHLKQLVDLARMPGLAPVVEIFDQADLDMAREAGADIIQVTTATSIRLKHRSTSPATSSHRRRTANSGSAQAASPNALRLKRWQDSALTPCLSEPV